MTRLQKFYLKLLSFILGLTLWFYVQGLDVVETSLKVPIFFSNISKNLYLDEISNSEVSVWIKGPKNTLSQILKSDKKLEINLNGHKEGKSEIKIMPSMLDFPRNVEITRIHPEKIKVLLVLIMQKKVKVKADYEGTKHIYINPPYVLVSGERKALEKLNFVMTEPLNDADSRSEITVDLVLPNDKFEVKPSRVKVLFK